MLLAANGHEAMDIFRAAGDAISAVILDIAMPGMSGEETCRRMKAIRPETPVIVCSGYSELVASERFGAREVDAFLQKPFTPEQLGAAIENATNRK